MNQSRLQIILELVDKMSAPVKSARGKISASLSNLKQNWMSVLGAVGAVTGAIKAAYEVMQRGEAINRAELSLQAYAGSAEEAERALEAVQKASEGALSRFDAMRSATRLLALGLADNAEEAGKLSRMAIMLGAAIGREAGPAIEDFSLMLSNVSMLRMDNFGLSSEKARKRIKELQKEITGLSRETAFKMTVMEQAADKLGQLEEAGVGAATETQRLKAELQDLTDEMAQNLTPVLLDLLDLIRQTREEQIEFYQETGIGQRFLQAYGYSAEDAHAAMAKLGQEIEDSYQPLQQQIDMAREAARATGELADSTGRAKSETEKLRIRIGELTQAEIGADAMRDLTTAYEEAMAEGNVDKAEEIRQAMQDVGTEMLGLPLQAVNMSIAIATASQKFKEEAVGPREYADELQRILDLYQDLERIGTDGITLPEFRAPVTTIPRWRGGLVEELRELE